MLPKSDQVKNFFKLSQYKKQPVYKDTEFEAQKFKIDEPLLTKMLDLRMWQLTYAPSATDGLRRIQEVHHLNNEILYTQYKQGWKRLVILPVILFFLFKFGKGRYLQHGEQDNMEMSWRDIQAMSQ